MRKLPHRDRLAGKDNLSLSKRIPARYGADRGARAPVSTPETGRIFRRIGSGMTEKLLNEEIARQVKEVFAQLQEPVEVLFFGRKEDCDYFADTLQLAQEIVELSDKLGLSVYDLDEDLSLAEQYHVDKAPGLALAGKDGDQISDYGIRYAGIPSGHEFSSLIHDLVLVSSRDSGLEQKTRDFLKGLEQPVLLQVFVTPT